MLNNVKVIMSIKDLYNIVINIFNSVHINKSINSDVYNKCYEIGVKYVNGIFFEYSPNDTYNHWNKFYNYFINSPMNNIEFIYISFDNDVAEREYLISNAITMDIDEYIDNMRNNAVYSNNYLNFIWKELFIWLD